MRTRILSLFSLWAPLLALCLVTSASADEPSVSCEVNAKWIWNGRYFGLALTVTNHNAEPIYVLVEYQAGHKFFRMNQRRIEIQHHAFTEERAEALGTGFESICALQPLRFRRIDPGTRGVLNYRSASGYEDQVGWPVLGWVSIVEGEVYELMKGKETSREHLATIDRVIECTPSVVPPRPTKTKRERRRKADEDRSRQ